VPRSIEYSWGTELILLPVLSMSLYTEQTDKWKALKPRVKAVNVPKWAQRSQESIWEYGGEVRDGAGKRVMECEMCTEKNKEGRGWKRQWQ
jgi:hypothetical protein